MHYCLQYSGIVAYVALYPNQSFDLLDFPFHSTRMAIIFSSIDDVFDPLLLFGGQQIALPVELSSCFYFVAFHYFVTFLLAHVDFDYFHSITFSFLFFVDSLKLNQLHDCFVLLFDLGHLFFGDALAFQNLGKKHISLAYVRCRHGAHYH